MVLTLKWRFFKCLQMQSQTNSFNQMTIHPQVKMLWLGWVHLWKLVISSQICLSLASRVMLKITSQGSFTVWSNLMIWKISRISSSKREILRQFKSLFHLKVCIRSLHKTQNQQFWIWKRHTAQDMKTFNQMNIIMSQIVSCKFLIKGQTKVWLGHRVWILSINIVILHKVSIKNREILIECRNKNM